MKSIYTRAAAASLLAISGATFAQVAGNPQTQDEPSRPAMRSRSGASAGEGPGAMSIIIVPAPIYIPPTQ
jgi:hypothetical protein